jgi:SAM-dependent methyltransferase
MTRFPSPMSGGRAPMNADLARKVSQDVFEARYSQNDDPWDFATSAYELGRYQTTLSALSRTNYGTVYEPGCSVGVLTSALARMAAHVIAIDFAPSAVLRARTRCAASSNVEIHCASVATYVPDPPLDLVVFSELGYYFDPPELARIGRVLSRKLNTHGEFLAVHWLGHSPDHVMHGDQVHETLRRTLPLVWMKGERYPLFRIDSWRAS